MEESNSYCNLIQKGHSYSF